MAENKSVVSKKVENKKKPKRKGVKEAVNNKDERERATG
jgi:hypothetical protein